jgi:hypothetical protein
MCATALAFLSRMNEFAGPSFLQTFVFFGAATIVVWVLKFLNAFLSLFILRGTNVSSPSFLSTQLLSSHLLLEPATNATVESCTSMDPKVPGR